MLFRAGYHRGQEIALRRVTRAAVADGYVPSAGGLSNGQNIGRDVALLKLQSEIFSAEADPFRVIRDVANGTQVSVVSYGRGREEVLSRQASCALTRTYRDGVLGFDCDVTFGSSGAPVFIREDGRLRIFSVVSAMSAEPGRNEAFGMVLPPIVDALMARMRMSDGRPAVSSGARRITVGTRGGTGARFVRP
jgi:protease YdgD